MLVGECVYDPLPHIISSIAASLINQNSWIWVIFSLFFSAIYTARLQSILPFLKHNGTRPNFSCGLVCENVIYSIVTIEAAIETRPPEQYVALVTGKASYLLVLLRHPSMCIFKQLQILFLKNNECPG